MSTEGIGGILNSPAFPVSKYKYLLVLQYVIPASHIWLLKNSGGGYSKIIASLSGQLQPEQSLLNTQVTEIEWDPNYLIGVKCLNPESGEVGIYYTKTLVVTVPLGVLQNGDIEFIPPLPDEKEDAINDIGFGTLNKAIMYWNRTTQDVDWFPSEVDGQLITENDENSEEWTYFFNDHSQDGNEDHYVLTSWCGGDAAEVWDGRSDNETIAFVVNNLRSMFGSDVPDPTSFIVTHWKSEVFTRGSYSFDIAGTDSSKARRSLAESIDDRIFFAGEATDTEWWGTAVGAYNTGREVADDIEDSGILQLNVSLPLPPTEAPSEFPSSTPTSMPSLRPSRAPSEFPSSMLSFQPSERPSSQPTTSNQPSLTGRPSPKASSEPSERPVSVPAPVSPPRYPGFRGKNKFSAFMGTP